MAEPVKGFGLIERFSEDIDLIFDWRLLGYRVDDPWEKRGNTKQDAFVRQINEDAASFLREALIPEMQTHLGGNTTRGFSRAAMSLDIKKVGPFRITFIHVISKAEFLAL